METNNTNSQIKKKILAFGDSLTRGYYSKGAMYHPYSLKLNELLQTNNFNYEVSLGGKNAETTDKMIIRIEEFFGDDKENYDIVILYVGTNDLRFWSSEITIENIQTLTKYVTSKGCKAVLVTLPGNECDDSEESYKERRSKINDAVKKLIEEGELTNTYICDLDKEIDYSNRTEKEKKEIYDDLLHFTAEGYDKLGEILYKTLVDKNLL